MIVNAVELSRPVVADRIPSAGSVVKLTAEPAERQALAERLGVREVVSLSAEVRLKPVAGGTIIRLKGHFTADVVQTCIVTLVPVPEHLEESFEMSFAPDIGEEGEVEVDFHGDDPPDPIEGGLIDVGEAVAEHLALALDPFPRAPGAVFEPPTEPDDAGELPASPFAKLARLRENGG